MSSPDPRAVVTRRAITVWVAAVAVYVVAITGRTSFGVAGVEAIDRFGIDASRIAVFTAVQIGVYAFAQIPTGMLIDRFGPRKMLVVGALIMGTGQILLGLTGNYWVAILARVLIGAGDASAFLSVMRILPYWFPLKKTPLFTQLTASLGQLGQFISAVPFMALLHVSGWTTSFISLGAVGVLIALAAGVAVADSPDTDAAARQARADRRAGTPPAPAGTAAAPERTGAGTLLKMVLRSPVCWLGFFIHYSCMLPQIVFTLLWGVPMMILGMGLSSAQAALVLSINTICTVAIGPLLGMVSSRLGARRELGALTFTLIIGLTWIIFFLSDTPRGLLAIIIVNIIVAVFTPAANFGFDHVREQLDRKSVATGTGLSNMGGFLSGMLAAQLVGVLLDWSSRGATYGWQDFRIAWMAVIAVWALGVLGLLVSRSAMLRGNRGNGGLKVVSHTEV